MSRTRTVSRNRTARSAFRKKPKRALLRMLHVRMTHSGYDELERRVRQFTGKTRLRRGDVSEFVRGLLEQPMQISMHVEPAPDPAEVIPATIDERDVMLDAPADSDLGRAA